FEQHREHQGTNLQLVAIVKLNLTLDLFVVDERAIGAVEVADEGFAFALQDGTMAFADHRARGAEMALRIPSDHELGQFDLQHLPLVGTRRLHYQAQFHVTTSFPMLRTTASEAG